MKIFFLIRKLEVNIYKLSYKLKLYLQIIIVIMANSKSAQKRIEINKRNQLRNKYYKTSVRNLIKLFFNYLESYKISQNSDDKQKIKDTLSSIYSFIDKGTKKKVFHKNMAARRKAKLAAYLKAI